MKFTTLTPFDAPPRTAGELAREKRLRDDPMADVHGPLFVTCKRCGSRIKLSPKSLYDPFHWMKHRERCLRKPVGVARAPRQSPKHTIRSPGPTDAAPQYTSPAKKSPASSDGDNATPPPRTPDDDRPAGSDNILHVRSPSPSMGDDPDLPAQSTPRALDAAFLDYLHRSQRPVPKHVPLDERWQTWRWSELQPPRWLTIQDHRPTFVSDDQGDWEDDFPLDVVEMRLPAPRVARRSDSDVPLLSA